MPLSLLTGRRDVMSLLENDVFFFSTFGGEALSLAAAMATINVMKSEPVIKHLSRQGRRLRSGIESILRGLGEEGIHCQGYDCRTLLSFDPRLGDPLHLKSLVQQELIKRGILWGGIHNISYSHTDEDIDYAIEAYAQVLPLVRAAAARGNVLESLRGRPLAPVFRRLSGFNTRPRAIAATR